MLKHERENKQTKNQPKNPTCFQVKENNFWNQNELWVGFAAEYSVYVEKQCVCCNDRSIYEQFNIQVWLRGKAALKWFLWPSEPMMFLQLSVLLFANQFLHQQCWLLGSAIYPVVCLGFWSSLSLCAWMWVRVQVSWKTITSTVHHHLIPGRETPYYMSCCSLWIWSHELLFALIKQEKYL